VGVPTVFLLDVLGELYFWPSWSRYDADAGAGVDYQLLAVPVGRKEIEVVPSFVWPDTGDASLDGLRFYGAMLTEDLRDIRGTWDMAEWGYGPAAGIPADGT
jgi:hypothetical protein